MRVAAVLHRPSTDPAGAERMLHGMLAYLVEKGHEVTQINTRGYPSDQVVDGITMLAAPADPANTASVARRADVVLTHLDATTLTLKAAGEMRRPCVVVEHNTSKQHKELLRHGGGAAGLIFNSEWMSRDWQRVPLVPALPQVIVHPPVNPADYRTKTTGEFVTVINLFKNGAFSWEVAALMPDVKFMFVKGGYGRQTIPSMVPKNVLLIDPTQDPRADIYSRSKIVMMPSRYESWGRVAIEAACSGIPTVTSPAEGLVEGLSYAAVVRPLDDPYPWTCAVRALLDDPAVYRAYSQMAAARAAQVWVRTQEQLAQMEGLLARLVREWRTASLLV